MLLFACFLASVTSFQIHQPFRRSMTEPKKKLQAQTVAVPSLNSWDPTNWTPKRLHNSPLFRSASILGALGFAGVSSRSPLARISAKAAGTIHILSFGTFIGTVFYTTFVLGLTMYKNLPRQTFGKLQSKLFPKYFNLCSICLVLQVRL